MEQRIPTGRLELSRTDVDRLYGGEVVIVIDLDTGQAVELWPAWANYSGRPTLVKSD